MFWQVVELVALIGGITALCWSTLLFASEGVRGGGSDRLLASFSSLVSLLCFVGIYSGVVRLLAGALLDEYFAGDWTEQASEAIRSVDSALTRAVNIANPGSDVAYRPDVSVVPLLLLAISYLCRWAIFRYANKKDTPTLSRVGSAYLSHVTAYLLLVCYAVIVVGWNAWLVVPGSLVAAVVVLAGVRPIARDIVDLAGAGIEAGWNLSRAAMRRLARAAASFASVVKEAFQAFSAFYDEKVSARVKGFSSQVRTGSKTIDLREKQKLADLERRKREGASSGDSY